MERKPNRSFKDTRFFSLFFNNRMILFLSVCLLILLNILILVRVRTIFSPLVSIFNIVGPPLIFSGLAYYILKPLIEYFEGRGLSKRASILILFLIIILLLVAAVIWLVPLVQVQVNQFIEAWPSYWNSIVAFFDRFIQWEGFRSIWDQVQSANIMETISNQANTIVQATILGIGNVIGVISQATLTIFTLPFIVYYMFVDGEAVPRNLMKITPTKWREPIMEILSSINFQLGYYVRGQVVVAIVVGIMFSLGFWMIGLDYALLLGLLSGVLNLIPYVGSIIAAALALIIAFFDSLWMVFLVIIVLLIEQFIEGRLVQPLVLGNQLNIHPITIIFILLLGGRFFGLYGLLLVIPAYAILKIIFSSIFNYLHQHSDLYAEEEEEPIDVHEAVIDVPEEQKAKIENPDLDDINQGD